MQMFLVREAALHCSLRARNTEQKENNFCQNRDMKSNAFPVSFWVRVGNGRNGQWSSPHDPTANFSFENGEDCFIKVVLFQDSKKIGGQGSIKLVSVCLGPLGNVCLWAESRAKEVRQGTEMFAAPGFEGLEGGNMEGVKVFLFLPVGTNNVDVPVK